MPLSDRATVIYNPGSGGGNGVGVDDVQRCLQEQGIDPTVHRTQSVADLDEILPESSGLIVTCGGDGTLSAVLDRVAGRDDVQIAHVPLGTANNLGHALGLVPNSLEALEDLASRSVKTMDLGNVRQAGRTARFFEGFGCGIFAELLHAYDPDQGKSVMRALETLADVLPSFDPVHVRASVDGSDVSGEYLIFAVANTKRIGPQIELAPDADPCDGKFDVVTVEPEGRSSLVAYVQARITGDLGAMDGAVIHRGSRVSIEPDGFTFHVDTRTYDTAEPDEDSDRSIHVGVDEDAIDVLVPA